MKRRSVVFFRNNYYHFFYLAKALRKRGWDAIVVSPDDPMGKDAFLFHGEDRNIYDSDPVVFNNNISSLLMEATDRFDLLHFCGDNLLGLYPLSSNKLAPPEILEWKKLGKKIAYTPSGCLSATAQSSVGEWSLIEGKNTCNVCSWQNVSHVCSDYRNLFWGRKVEAYADIIFSANLPFLDYLSSPKSFRVPIMCLDPDIWSSDLKIPEEFRENRTGDEIIIYHAVGNYNIRTQGSKNIKGTGAVIDAIKRLQENGYNCRLVFKTDVDNINVRYIQAQADIIVDQLNIGRYGATARECMMLGKPVICYINKQELVSEGYLTNLDELPLVSATEETLYEKLKELINSKSQRENIGKASRKYALKWHSSDACAEVYEKAYDELMEYGSYNNKLIPVTEGYEDRKKSDIFDYYISQALNNEFSEERLVDSYTNDEYFKPIWGKYLEYAWLFRKVPYYINKRIQEPLCEFGTHFEEALVKLELVQEPEALNEFHLSLQHFERRSEPFKEIDLSEYYFLISQTAVRCNELNEAGILLSKAVQLNKEYTEALEQLAELLFMAGHVEKAKETMERAYLSQPTRKSILSKLGEINLKLGFPEDDIVQKESWLRQRIVLSEEYMEAGELDKARQILEALEALFPDTLDVLNNIAVLEVLCGNTESALANIHRVLQLDPENEQALENRKVLAGY